MMFVHDGQFGFSLFPFLIHGLVAHFGPGAAARIVSGLGCLCSFAAATILAIQLVKGRAVWLMLVFACVLPHAYGSQVFQIAETMAVPRPFAEAAVLLSARRLDIRTASHCDRFGSRRCRAASDHGACRRGRYREFVLA